MTVRAETPQVRPNQFHAFSGRIPACHHQELERQTSSFNPATSILSALFECRVFTTTHAAPSAAERKPRRNASRSSSVQPSSLNVRAPNDPAVLSSPQGLETVRDDGVLQDFPLSIYPPSASLQVGSSTIRHELEVMDVRVAFYQAVTTRPDLTIPSSPPGPPPFIHRRSPKKRERAPEYCPMV